MNQLKDFTGWLKFDVTGSNINKNAQKPSSICKEWGFELSQDLLR